jgi:hypothetical protein
MICKLTVLSLTALANIALMATPTIAAPVGAAVSVSTSDVQRIRLVCDGSGKCWREANNHGYGYNPAMDPNAPKPAKKHKK